jgi:hypothetical protein
MMEVASVLGIPFPNLQAGFGMSLRSRRVMDAIMYCIVLILACVGVCASVCCVCVRKC